MTLLTTSLAWTQDDRARINVSPSKATIFLGRSVKLKASVRGQKGVPIRWEMVGGKETGTVTSTGIYRAPSSGKTPFTARVRASVADGGPSAIASVFVKAVRIQISPSKVNVLAGETAAFKTKVRDAGDTRVTWSVDGGRKNGVIAPSGLFTAPPILRTPARIAVRATSVADPSKSATAIVQVGEVQIKISPQGGKLKHGQSKRFKVKIKGAASEDVTWRVVGGDMNGTVSPTGMYKTPPSMKTPTDVLVRVTSVADPSKFEEARIQVAGVQLFATTHPKRRGGRRNSLLHRVRRRVTRIFLPLDPIDLFVRGPRFRGKSGKNYVPLGGVVEVYAHVVNTNNERLVWEILGDNPVGAIGDDGVYQAPSTLMTPAVVQVRCTSVADPSQTFIKALHIPPVVVVAKKDNFSCCIGDAMQLEAQVENAENDTLTWEVEGGDEFGTVTPNGLYNPPNSIVTPNVVRIRAVSVADPSKHAVIRIEIPEVKVSLSPGSTELKPGETRRFKANVKGIHGASTVTYEISPKIGRISPDGLYVAPETGGPAIVQVIATADADPTKKATATIRLKGN